jgi:uncharacterized protein YbjT (DUF2867 family)
MARILIVGCGCRGRELAGALVEEGHSVRGTTRREMAVEAIEATGAQAALADPDRLSTLLPQIEGVSVVCWLMGGAVGEPEVVAAVHGPRLQTLLEQLVDTPVRGVVYEAAGRVQPRWLERGVEVVRAAGQAYRMPVEVVEQDPSEPAAWLESMRAAVARVLGS